MALRRVYHIPKGDPCAHCFLPAKCHRVEHAPQGEPCERCGLGIGAHYKKQHRPDRERDYYAGIDGEGQGRKDHRYVMLAWSNESGTCRNAIEAEEGGRLSTVQCLDFILSIPRHAKLYAFAFNYDLTKILTDVDDETLYHLFRPELRKRKPQYRRLGPKPVTWNGYQLNLMGSKFSVKRGRTRRVIWDTFKFFQSKFTTALRDWKVGEESVLARMEAMKERRADFDKLTRKQILAYCFDECAYMATLARKLIEAHDTAGLSLRSYHGAGSTASALLKKLKIDKETRHGPLEIAHAVACSFFGGRFENSVIGVVEGPLWSYDISSAYPYQITFLPCLHCGEWKKTKKRQDLEGATTAIVHYGLGKPPKGLVWGPYPFRLKNGSIAFPATSGGGWVWLSEYLAGEKLFPHVQFREAWVYRTACRHKPFAEIPRYYIERLRIGKEGPGIVIKLGCNACYGKMAQSLGDDPPFQSWIWAGMITAGTRAQLLDMLGLHKDPSNLLMVATDGIQTRERIKPPVPRDTGTFDALNEHGQPANKPLGGWEEKRIDKPMFYARPGVYLPILPKTDDMKSIRARGIGRRNAMQTYKTMIDAWQGGLSSVVIAKVARFNGAKSSIGRAGKEGTYTYVRHSLLDDDGNPIVNSLTRKPIPRYGQWTERPIELSFNPLPKREKVNRDGQTLQIRSFPQDLESIPYDRSVVSLEGWNLRRMTEEVLEQPDGAELVDYEPE